MNTFTKLTLAIVGLPPLLVLLQFRQHSLSKAAITKPSASQQVPFTDTLCHTDPGLDVRTVNKSSPDASKCYGKCVNATRAVFPYGIEAPRMSSLCILNPFHGFYDCIWPLVHYISTCLPLRSIKPPILTDNEELSDIRKKKWAVRAQLTYLQGINARTIEMNRVPNGTCICFKHLVKFRRTAFFRPTRFQYELKLRSSNVTASHASLMKRDGLRMFRRTVLQALNLQSDLQNPHSPILVYGREDASRRRWVNIDEFIALFQPLLPKGTEVIRIPKIPKAFEEQVQMFNRAAMVIAPHGAAMANTLFMKPGTAILEIASRKCLREGEDFDMDEVENVQDENAWMPWHAQSLGLYHMSAACFRAEGGNGAFETDNESLVNLALLLLKFPRRADE